MSRAFQQASVGYVRCARRPPGAAKRLRLVWPTLRLACVLLLALPVMACGSSPRSRPAPRAGVGCTRIASPTGSDRARGTATRPYRTVRRLLGALHAGQVGCLEAGTYTQNVEIVGGGRRGHPLTLRSLPGQTATIQGRLWIARSAAFVTIEDLKLDGKSRDPACHGVPCPSPTVDAEHATFAFDDVTNEHTAICFDLGNRSYGIAVDTLITRSRIHDCGLLPATNHNHGIYVEAARNTTIVHNLIADNADRAIQFYPQSIGSRIENNLIIGNGEGVDFSGLGNLTSSDNIVRGNVIVDSQRGANVYSYYAPGTPAGKGNHVDGNCIGGNPVGNPDGVLGVGPPVGFTLRNNIAATAVDAIQSRKLLVAPRLTVRSPHCARLLRATDVGYSIP